MRNLQFFSVSAPTARLGGRVDPGDTRAAFNKDARVTRARFQGKNATRPKTGLRPSAIKRRGEPVLPQTVALAQLETIPSSFRLNTISPAIGAIFERLLAEPQLEFRIKVTSVWPLPGQ